MDITPEEQALCFKALDTYARTKYNCFVAEFDASPQGNEYFVCFRPLGVGRDDANRYACKYLHFDMEEIRATVLAGSLPTSSTQKLDQGLSDLLHS
jgi:hypothetical protein